MVNSNISEVRPYRAIERKKVRQIKVGDVLIGGDAPITLQSMTNTLTTDVQATIKQVNECAELGAEIMRISVPDKDSTQALKSIIPNCEVPIVADIHFHYKRAIEAAIAGAKCLRINPGNIGSDEKVKEVVKAAKDYGCSIRIGVNAGSLEQSILEKYKTPCPEALVESAKFHMNLLEQNDFYNFKISVKASDIFLAVASYRKIATICDYPLHLGITEAGGFLPGTVKSSIGLGMLLMEGIGDTMRVSISDDPKEEIRVGNNILKSLGLRKRGVSIISCPSCARQAFNVIEVVKEVEKRVEHIKEPIEVSILGCVVNGLGEAAHTHIGITGGGNMRHNVYIDGKPNHKIDSDKLVNHIVSLIEERIKLK